MEYKIISEIAKKSNPKEVLQLALGFDNDVMFGYYVRATPKRVRLVEGVEIANFAGSDIREKKLMDGKHFSKKRFDSIETMIKLNVSEFVKTTFPEDKILESFFKE